MTEKRFHPFAVLHLLRKTILLYLLPLVQVLFARNWAALWAALVQDLVLFALLSAACWAVLHASGWQMDAHGNLLVRWRLGTAWMLVVTGWLFCISLARSAAQVAHYTVWRTAAQLGSRGGLLHRYEMRLCRAHLNYADLRRSPVTRALHYCPVFVTAGSCAPELPLFVWKEGTPLLQELLPGIALPPDTAPDITRRSKIYFLPAGLPLGLCLLLTAVSRTTLPTLTLPLLVPDLFFAALLAAAFVGYRREGAWMQDDHLTLRRQKGLHLHCVCALHPDLCLTVQQSPWAVAAHRANLTLIFPGRLKQKVRSVALTELAFLQQAE